MKDKAFIRVLATAVFEHSIELPNSSMPMLKPVLQSETLIKYVGLLTMYVDTNTDYEVQCLYALQALVKELEHPQGKQWDYVRYGRLRNKSGFLFCRSSA